MTTDDKRPERKERRPFNTGKKPFKGKRDFGDKPKSYAGPRPDRGTRPDRGDKSKGRPFNSDRGPREGGFRGEGERPNRSGGGFRDFSDRGAPRSGDRDRPRGRPFGGDRDRGPRPDGDRPRARPFGDRGAPRGGEDRPRRSFGGGEGRSSGSGDRGGPRGGDRDRGPRSDGYRTERKYDGTQREDKPRAARDSSRPPRDDNSPFRGMYGRPKSEGDYPRGDRPFRKDPRTFKDNAHEEFPAGKEDTAEGMERPHLGDDELRYLGKNACLGLWKARPDDVVRVYVLKELADEFSDIIEYCAKNRKSYHLVGPNDLQRLTDSVHHQGICMIARAKSFFKEAQFFGELGAHRTLVMYLDGVANPHNLGAILRTAAHFGVKFVCVPGEEITKISPALYRTAEGAAEVVNLVRVEDTEKFLDRLQSQGFHLYAFEAGEESKSLFETRLNEKSVFVFGAEVTGLSGLVKTIVETKLKVPGTGAVESLNVSVAAAIAIAEFEKQGMQRTVRIVKNKS